MIIAKSVRSTKLYCVLSTESAVSVLVPARAGAGEHLLGGARHVVLQPEEDRLAGRHLCARAMRGGERLQHLDHRRLEHLVDRPAHPSPPGPFRPRRMDVGVWAAQRVAPCVHARALQPLEQLVPARRRAEDQHAFVEPQPLGDEIDERVKEAVFLLVEVQHVRHAAHASAARFTALSRRLSPNLYIRNGKPRLRYWIISQPPIMPPTWAKCATPAAVWVMPRKSSSAAKPKTKTRAGIGIGGKSSITRRCGK